VAGGVRHEEGRLGYGGRHEKRLKKNRRQGLPGRRILAVEMAGDDIRAAVVRRQGRGFEIIDYASLKRPETGEDLPDVASLKALAERLGVGGGAAVLVSPLARAFELLMDRAKIKGMKPYQLREAVKWEVEPYTGISGVTALIAVERKQEPKAKPGDIVYEDDDQTTVNVAAIERNVYRAVRERFKVAGFRLTRIYPPEACFYFVLHMDGRDTPRAVLEVGQDYSNFAVLSGGIPQQINTLSLSQESIAAHVSGEIPSQDLIDTLRFTVRQVPEPEPLVLSGPGATDQSIADFIAGVLPSRGRAPGPAPLRRAGRHQGRPLPRRVRHRGRRGHARAARDHRAPGRHRRQRAPGRADPAERLPRARGHHGPPGPVSPQPLRLS
jgi:hypothetical protein